LIYGDYGPLALLFPLENPRYPWECCSHYWHRQVDPQPDQQVYARQSFNFSPAPRPMKGGKSVVKWSLWDTQRWGCRTTGWSACRQPHEKPVRERLTGASKLVAIPACG